MSASNWTVCPRCFENAKREADESRAEVMALYGTIPVEEFDARRAALVEPAAGDFETFREDYQFFGAAGGEVHADYEGACTKCSLRVDLQMAKRFWPEADAG